MLKKMITCLAAALLSFQAHADGEIYALSTGGPYLGVGGGYQLLQSRQTSNSFAYNPLDSSQQIQFLSENAHFQGSGALGNLFLGYGLCLGNGFFLGLQLDSSLATTEGSRSEAFGGSEFISTLTEKYKGGLGFSLKPAVYLANDTLLYLSIGYLKGKFNTQYTSSIGVGELSFSLSESKDTWLNGAAFGLGMDHYFTENFSLRFEYLHTQFPSVTKTTAVPLSIANLSISSSTKPSLDQVTLNVVFSLGAWQDIADKISAMTY